ncbi:MAG: 50S ribosomal protein L29 [Patescibacteria group bacterium]
MKIKELQNKSEEALKTMLKDLRDKLRDLNFKVSQKQLKNIRDVRKTKKSIAQILTILNLKKNHRLTE